MMNDNLNQSTSKTKYIIALVVFVVATASLIGIWLFPKDNAVLITPDISSSEPLASSSDIEVAVIKEYSLALNKAEAEVSANRIFITGHFWHELTDAQLHASFPSLSDDETLTATANFSADFKGGSTLVDVAGYVTLDGEKTAYIQVAPQEIPRCYILDDNVEVSDILGVEVTAGYHVGDSDRSYFANFMLEELRYYVEFTATEEDNALFSSLIGSIIGGGAADISVLENPLIPNLRDDELTLSQAYQDPDFGAHLPSTVPTGFVLESCKRFINQQSDYLWVTWSRNYDNIRWVVSEIEEIDKSRISEIADTENYDMSLYPIPQSGSVPSELREIVDNPIFRIEDLTLDAVMARAYKIEDQGDTDGYRMRFSVLYGDKLVELSVKGTAPEGIYDILTEIELN